MSVLDGKVIDASALNNKTVILAIFDALPWREYIIETHITALQNKLNDYLDFIEGDQISQHYTQDQYEQVVIRLIAKYNFNDKALYYLNMAKDAVGKAGYFFEWQFHPLSEKDLEGYMDLTDSGPRLRKKDLDKLEKDKNIKLPEDYRNFLLQNNGGITQTEVEFFLDEDRYMRKTEPGCGIDIQYFYSLDKIRETYEKMVSEESIAPSFIPIACDSYGDQILLQSQNEPEKGVFFAGCESAAGRNGLWPLVKITDSFTEFLGMLTPFRELVE